MTKALITGIGGGIGCHVLDCLLRDTDWEIIGIDSFRHRGTTDRAVEVLKHYSSEDRDRVSVITHDLAAPFSEMTRAKMECVDYIFNLASLSDVPASICKPTEFVMNNVAMMMTMLELARHLKPRMFLHISTDEVFGPTTGHTHTEWDPLLPSSPYSASKAAQEMLAISYWRTFDVPLVITNFMNNFGEMQSPTKFPVIAMRKIYRGETLPVHADAQGNIGRRFYIHSRTTANMLLYLARNIVPPLVAHADRPERFNLAGDTEYSNLELGQMIADVMKLPLKYKIETSTRPGYDPRYGLDMSKLSKLGWIRPTSTDEEWIKTIRWYERHPEWLGG